MSRRHLHLCASAASELQQDFDFIESEADKAYNRYVTEGDNVVINKAIIGGEAKIRKDCKIGDGEKISVIASKEDVKSGSVIKAMDV